MWNNQDDAQGRVQAFAATTCSFIYDNLCVGVEETSRKDKKGGKNLYSLII